MRVDIDVIHSAAWKLDIQRKPGPGRPADFSEIGVISHIVELIGECFGGSTRLLEFDLDEDVVKGSDLLLIPAPGVDGAVFTSAERDSLETYVRAGGAVLVLGDGEDRPAARGEDAPFGIGLGGLLSGDATDPTWPHVRSHDFTLDTMPAHSVTENIGRVRVYRPKGVVDSSIPLVPLIEYENMPLVGVAELGAGRLAVVGNAEMFSLPFLGREDNARLLLDLLAWLSGREPIDSAGQQASKVTNTFRFTGREFSHTENLKEESGAHVIDARPYGHLLNSLADGYLPNPESDQDAFLDEAEMRFHEMPRVIRHAVARFRKHSTDPGILLVKGLPVDQDLPATPVDPSARVRFAKPLSELWLAAFAQALGEPIAYRQEKRGQLFQNVAPTRGNAEKLSSESSSILLDFHTEAAFHPFMPDYVLLHCLRPDHNRSAKTISASLRMAISRLSLRERTILGEPLFRTGIDYSFGSTNGQKGNGPLLRVLYGDPFDPYITVDPDLMVGETSEAAAALLRLHAALNEVKRWVQLDAGDLLIIDNRRAVHGRSEFVPRYDGFDRWLQRVCVVRDLTPSAGHRRVRGRVIDTAFAV